MAKIKTSLLPPGVRPIGLDLAQSAQFVGVSPNNLVKMIRDGAMPPPRAFGARRIWIVGELEAALAALPFADSYSPAEAEGAAQ